MLGFLTSNSTFRLQMLAVPATYKPALIVATDLFNIAYYAQMKTWIMFVTLTDITHVT